MEITYDADKREWTRDHRGLDFEDATLVFAGPEFTVLDDRFEYGEERVPNLRAARGAAGDDRLDRAWQGAPHHLDEKVQ